MFKRYYIEPDPEESDDDDDLDVKNDEVVDEEGGEN